MADLQSHRCRPYENKKFYRVYDKASQSRFVPRIGFEASKRSTSEAYEYRITPNALGKHLDWFDPDPSPFISLYDNPWVALKEAWRRILEKPRLYDQKVRRVRMRGPVRIAVIDAEQLDREGVFYLSRNELFSMVNIAPDDVIRRRFRRREYMAMDRIPASAVEARFSNMGDYRQYCHDNC